MISCTVCSIATDRDGAAKGLDDSLFVLEPVETTGVEKRVKKKRRLVVDTDKEFTGAQIKSQFDDFKDLLQPKCFPPPTKKAMMWKEMAGCDQLYSNPTFPSLGLELRELITYNYSMDIPGEPAPENLIELDSIADTSREADVVPVDNVPQVSGIDASITDSTVENVEQPDDDNELPEERRWTKRTQQVLHILQKKFSDAEVVFFSSLTQNCNRKQAASRFYTCLLLAKEGMVAVAQAEPYADIRLVKGPKYV